MNKTQPDFGRILLAFAIIYLVWGSTYLANTWAVLVIPPFFLAGFRFVIAGILMLGFSWLFGKVHFTWAQFKNASFAGLFLFAMGNGLVVWALQHVDSGIAALVVALEPLIVVLLMWEMKNDRPTWNSWLGLSLGIIGTILLVGQPQFVSNFKWLTGVLAIFVAISSWGFISVWMTTADLPKSLIQSAALQMLTGGVMLFALGWFNGEFTRLQPFTNKALVSLVYLIVFGSILAFTAFNYLLTKVSPTLIATSAYVNPVVALFLGWWLNHEQISLQSIAAASILLTGVVFISMKKRSKGH